MERMENKTKLLIEEVEKHPCLYNCMFVLAIYCLRNCAEAIFIAQESCAISCRNLLLCVSWTLVSKTGSRDWKHLSISLALKEALANMIEMQQLCFK